MAVTSETLCASREHVAELRAELASVSQQLDQQALRLQGVQAEAETEVAHMKDAAVDELVTRHKAALAAEEAGFEAQLRELERSMQAQREALTRGDEAARQEQLEVKKSIETAARERTQALKESLSAREREIQSSFAKALETEQERVAALEREMESAQRSEQKTLHALEHFADADAMVDLPAQRRGFEAQMRELRLEHRGRIGAFEGQSAEMLGAKQRFFQERLDHIRAQEREQAGAARDLDAAGEAALAAHAAACEEDLRRQEEFLQLMLAKATRTRQEVDRMNGEEERKLQMRSDRKGFRGRIAKLRAELP